MMTAPRHGPSADPMTQRKAAPLVTWRIEIEGTGRTLLRRFHIEPSVTDAAHRHPLVAEFGSCEVAALVSERIDLRTPLTVVVHEWPATLSEQQRSVLRSAVADTGADASLFLWAHPEPARRICIDCRGDLPGKPGDPRGGHRYGCGV